MSYKVDGTSDLGFKFRFTGNNDEFLLDAFNASHVLLDTIEIDGRLQVLIEINEDTTQEQLRKVLPYALELRNKLFDFQGAWAIGGPNAFYERLSQEQEHGRHYSDIAESLKLRVAELLREAVAFDDEFRKALPTLKNYGEYFMWAYGKDGIYKQYNPESFNHARRILELLKLNEKDVTAWLEQGIANIRAGKEPFPQNPIIKKKITDLIRNWRKKKEHKSIKAHQEKAKVKNTS